jgi:hypothetical protein
MTGEKFVENYFSYLFQKYGCAVLAVAFWVSVLWGFWELAGCVVRGIKR